MERLLRHTGLFALIACAVIATADDKNFKPFYKVLEKEAKLGNAVGLDVKVTADKGFIVAGKRKVDNNRWDAFLAKFKPSNELDWVESYGTAEDDEAVFVSERLEQDRVVGYIVFGNTTSQKTNPYAWCRNTDEKGIVIKDGGRKDFDDIAYDAQKIVHVSHVRSDGVKNPEHFLIAGIVKAIDRPLPNAWIAKVDAFGKIQKESKFGYDDKGWGMSGAFVGRVSPEKVILITNSSPKEDGYGRVDYYLMDETEKSFSWKPAKPATDSVPATSEEKINDETEQASKATAATLTSDGNVVIALSFNNGGARAFSLVKVNNKGRVIARSTKLVLDEKDRLVTKIIESKNENKELILIGSVAEARKVNWKDYNSERLTEAASTNLPQFWISRMTQHLRLKWNRTLQSSNTEFVIGRYIAGTSEVVRGTAYGVVETEDHETIVVGSAGRGKWDKNRPNGNYATVGDPVIYYDGGDFLKVVGATCEGNCHK